MQLSHLKSLKQYWDRFEYRIAQLTATQLDALNNLLSGIHVHERRIGDSHSIRPCCSKGADRQPAASTLDRVPSIITAELSTDTEALHSLGVPAMFCKPMCMVEGATTPSKRKSSEADMLPSPLPSKRGAIRKQCKAVQEQMQPKTGRIAYIENSYKENVRTTMRVREPGQSGRTSWVEVSAKQHARHKEIVREIAAQVNIGLAVSREEARAMRDRLMEA